EDRVDVRHGQRRQPLLAALTDGAAGPPNEAAATERFSEFQQPGALTRPMTRMTRPWRWRRQRNNGGTRFRTARYWSRDWVQEQRGGGGLSASAGRRASGPARCGGTARVAPGTSEDRAVREPVHPS